MKIDSGLALFPLCDSRGWLTDILLNDNSQHRRVNAENLFFAWLLELPAGVDSKAAAQTVLDFTDRNGRNSAPTRSNKPECDVIKDSASDSGEGLEEQASLSEYRIELRALLLDLVGGEKARAKRSPDNLHRILEDLRRV